MYGDEIEDEDEKKYKTKRRQSRSFSIVNTGVRRKLSLGALKYADNDLSTVNENELKWKALAYRKSLYEDNASIKSSSSNNSLKLKF